MHHSVATVPMAATAAMLYARFAASSTGPGLRRLLALTPVLALLLVLPFSIPLYGVRGLVSFFLVWLGEFKLLLLAFGHGPLDPRIRPLPFVFTALLPVKLRQVSNSKDDDDDAADAKKTTKTKTPVLVSSGIKLAVTAAISHHLHHSNKEQQRTHPYVAFVLFGVVTYCILDSVLPCVAATGRALGMELEPQFDKPYLSASLQDFWGRRWNLVVSAVLRPSVYDPVRARLGAAAGVLSTFLVSGLMHEVMAYYLTFRAPTGQVTAFFLLHGASMCAERWCARRWRWRPPRLVATPLVVAFVASTACWLFLPAIFGGGMDDLFLPAIFGGGMDDLYLAEAAAVVSSFRGVVARSFIGLGSHMVLSV